MSLNIYGKLERDITDAQNTEGLQGKKNLMSIEWYQLFQFISKA